MMLCDTSIIVAAIRIDDNDHDDAFALMKSLRSPVITTWPCMTEAMHLVGAGGREKILQQIERQVYTLFPLTFEDALRTCQLMRTYADAPMDVADASLVVAAERLGVSRILTLDSHFHAYRINGKTPFVVIP